MDGKTKKAEDRGDKCDKKWCSCIGLQKAECMKNHKKRLLLQGWLRLQITILS